MVMILTCVCFFVKQETAYEMRISDWSQTCALPISVHHGMRETGPEVERARARARHADPGAAERAAVGMRHHRRRLFVADVDRADSSIYAGLLSEQHERKSVV